MRKSEDLQLNVDKPTRALASFMEAEARCKVTNETFSMIRRDKLFGAYTVDSVLYRAQEKIGHILSVDFSQWESRLGEFLASCDFGPRATYSLKRKEATVYNKFRKLGTTAENLHVAGFLVNSTTMWGRINPTLSVEPGCRITFVPKDAKTDRTIAVEPSMNMFVQKGIGSMIRRRFKSVARVDLNDQTVNQKLACEGSVTDSLATLDLSAASDSVSYELVKALLPCDWFCALEQARSSVAVLPSGEKHVFAKFSTMGNGATFELQSLIFWALCSACVELLGESGASVKVYGDDIVAPSRCYALISYVLERLGFVVNDSKSFSSGPFRESCGKHYFLGSDVSPFQFKGPVDQVPDLYWVANKFRDWCCRDYWFLEPWMKKEYDRIVAMVPHNLRFKVPDGAGDVGFESSFDEARPLTRRKKRKNRRDAGPIYQSFEYHSLSSFQDSFSPENEVEYVVWHHLRERSFNPLHGDISMPVKEARLRVTVCTTPAWPSDKFWI